MASARLFSPAEAADHSSAALFHASEGAEGTNVRGLAIDSRQVKEGDLFVALQGERTDGHNFLEEVARRGAAAVLIANEYCREEDHVDRLTRLGPAVLTADEPLSALQELAEWWVARHPGCLRIGVTGSNGKTTTKELIASILRQEGQTVWNEGNFNSEIGLPLAVFSITPQHRYGVFEMGMNHPGEMETLTRVLKPHYMVLTMLGTAHIGLLGSREAIAREKSRPFTALPAEGAGFLPEETEWEEFFTPKSGAPLYRFGSESQEGYRGAENLGLEGWRIHLGGYALHFPLIGEHNLSNALAAVRIARQLGISWDSIRWGLETVAPVWGRSAISRGAVTIVEDLYNANTESVSAMLRWLNSTVIGGRLICVLGAMKELGQESEAAHRSVGRIVAETEPDAAFFFGSETAAALEEAREAGFSGTGGCYTEYEELEEGLRNFVRKGDTVLLKGSRSMELERLVQPLQKAAEQTDHAPSQCEHK